jgi:hypothetical protein
MQLLLLVSLSLLSSIPDFCRIQLVFNLTDAIHWMDTYNAFSFQAFYNFIVDYFEDTQGPAAKERADDLLKWWNRYIFLVLAVTFVLNLVDATQTSLSSPRRDCIQLSQMPQQVGSSEGPS